MKKTHLVYMLAVTGIAVAFYAVFKESVALFLFASIIHLAMGIIGLCTPHVGLIARCCSLLIILLWILILLPSTLPSEEASSEQYIPVENPVQSI